jgi:glutamate synthase domain-containing protein 3
MGTLSTLVGKSPVESSFNFEQDIKEYESTENAPATEALQVEQVKAREAAIKAEEERQRQQKLAMEAQQVDPTDEVAQHQWLAPQDKLTPTANIEIDYANTDLSREDLTAVPEGTVGGHCGVYAENVVKLPGGGNWVVGDSIDQKTASIERYRKAGLAFKPGEDAPVPGNTIIQNPGTKWGHVAVINSIDENGVATLTESNWNWDKRVTHTRKIRLDDPSIVGFIRTQ